MKQKWIDKNFTSSLENKNIFITGGNSGIGFEFAKICAYLKANVFLVVRNLNKGMEAKKQLEEQFNDCKVKILLLDLSSFASIDSFAKEIINNKYDIDIFYNNAGIFRIKNQKTTDGFEIVMGTNYIGTFYLTKVLIPYLLTLNHEVKYILTTSITYRIGKIDYNNFFSNKEFKAYANSKLAIMKLFLCLCEKYKNTNLNFLLVHPGVCQTPIITKAYKKWFSNIANKAMKILFHSASKASLSTLYALDKNRKNIFVGPRGIYNIKGYPSINKISKKAYKDLNRFYNFSDDLIKKVTNVTL